MSVPASIVSAHQYVQKVERELEQLKQEAKYRRENLKAAKVRLTKVILDEMAGVQELPLSDPEANGQAEPDAVKPTGWDLVTSQPLTDDGKAEADGLAKIEAAARGAKGKPKRKRSRAKA